MSAIQQPICNATIEGPIVKDRGRSRPLWRRGCRRRVKWWGDNCWQHGGPRDRPTQTTDPNRESR